MEGSPLDALLTEECALIRSSVTDLAASAIADRAEAIDHEDVHPEEVWTELAGLGLFGIRASEEQGGAGLGFVPVAVAVEALARTSGGCAGLLLAQSLATEALLLGGDEVARGRNLPGLVSGEIFGTVAIEDEAREQPCRAAGRDGALVLNGAKVGVPFPGRAGVFVVTAVGEDGPVLAVIEDGAPGSLRHERTAALGMHGLELGRLELEDVHARALGHGQEIQKWVASVRIGVAALHAGTGRGVLDHALRYAGERKQFGVQLFRFGALQERLARADAFVEAAYALVLLAALQRDKDEPHDLAAIRARTVAASAALSAADDAVQVYGGYGYSREYPAERYYRDARFLGFGEATPSRLYAEAVEVLR